MLLVRPTLTTALVYSSISKLRGTQKIVYRGFYQQNSISYEVQKKSQCKCTKKHIEQQEKNWNK